jgi:N-acetylglucosaminyl-diphospho-decaprenol L-rhamnosyltransferase
VLDRLSVVIPSYNGREVLGRSLSTLLEAAPEAEVIVVDGGSSDGSPEMLRAQFPGVRLLEVANHGWAHATNRGFEAASRELLLTMNSDLFPTRPALEAMAARLLADERVGASGPVLLNGDGSRQLGFGILYWPNLVKVTKPLSVPILHGACLMTRRDVVERVGGMDERFFFYNEEFDWGWRATRAGYRLELVPERVVHLEGGSTPDGWRFQLEAQRGALYLLNKHFPPLISGGARLLFEFIGWAGKALDPRPGYRRAWAGIEEIARRRAYLESPFPLSGRGEWRPEPRS